MIRFAMLTAPLLVAGCWARRSPAEQEQFLTEFIRSAVDDTAFYRNNGSRDAIKTVGQIRDALDRDFSLKLVEEYWSDADWRVYFANGTDVLFNVRTKDDPWVTGLSLQHRARTNGKRFLALAGSYYRGDGTGLNLYLTLADDGTFECEWKGCLGHYGTTAGRWSLEGDRVVTTARVTEGRFEDDPLGDLHVVEREGVTLLVPENGASFFEEWGPSRYACFSRVDEDAEEWTLVLPQGAR